MSPLLLGLLACARPDPVEAGFAPELSRLDRNADGRVDEAEYLRVAFAAPVFAQADLDHDGALGAPELAALVRAQDPVYFDGVQTFAQTGTTALAGQAGADPDARQREVRDLLRFEAEEVAARGGVVPDVLQIAAAANTGSLDSAESRAALAQLHAEATRLGLAWPQGIGE